MLGSIAFGLSSIGKKNPGRFTPYSEIAHRGSRKAKRTDRMTADQIKHYIADKL